MFYSFVFPYSSSFLLPYPFSPPPYLSFSPAHPIVMRCDGAEGIGTAGVSKGDGWGKYGVNGGWESCGKC